MAKNALLRSICTALNLDDVAQAQIFRNVGRDVAPSTIAAFQKTEKEDGYIPCSDPILGFFLDGLIIHLRGQREGQPVAPEAPVALLSHNAVLKKLRIALDLKEEGVMEILQRGGIATSKNDLTGYFRKPGHKHYKECSEQFLTGFLKGVTLHVTKSERSTTRRHEEH